MLRATLSWSADNETVGKSMPATPKPTYIPAKGQTVDLNLHGVGAPSIPVVVGAIYVDDSTGNVFTGSTSGWVLTSSGGGGGGGAIYNGDGPPTIVPASSAALYYDKLTMVMYEWINSAWV